LKLQVVSHFNLFILGHANCMITRLNLAIPKPDEDLQVIAPVINTAPLTTSTALQSPRLGQQQSKGENRWRRMRVSLQGTYSDRQMSTISYHDPNLFAITVSEFKARSLANTTTRKRTPSLCSCSFTFSCSCHHTPVIILALMLASAKFAFKLLRFFTSTGAFRYHFDC
jgi:hypothetical protein